MALFLSKLRAQRGITSALSSRMQSLVGTKTLHSLRLARNTPEKIQAPVVQSRSQSTYPRGLRSFPQYTIHGETSMLSMKIILPGFKVQKSDILALDTTRKGRMLLEFTPRGPDGKYIWTDTIRFGLSVEELGLLVNQLPHYKVEFCRVQSASSLQQGVTEPDKVLTIEPAELGAISFTIDFILNGVGGQAPPMSEGSQQGVPQPGPIQVQVQAGEFEVMASLMNYSIPSLTGWSQMLDVTSQNQVSETLAGGGRSQGPVAGGGYVSF